jgi:hypothetical protein
MKETTKDMFERWWESPSSAARLCGGGCMIPDHALTHTPACTLVKAAEESNKKSRNVS